MSIQPTPIASQNLSRSRLHRKMTIDYSSFAIAKRGNTMSGVDKDIVGRGQFFTLPKCLHYSPFSDSAKAALIASYDTLPDSMQIYSKGFRQFLKAVRSPAMNDFHAVFLRENLRHLSYDQLAAPDSGVYVSKDANRGTC